MIGLIVVAAAAELKNTISCSLRRRNLTSIIAGKNAAAAVVGRKKKIASSLAQKERGRSFLRDVKRYAHFGPLFFFLLLLKPSSFSLLPPLMSPRLPPPPYFPTTNYVEIKLVETSPFLALLANTTRTRCCCCLLNPAALWRFLRLQREYSRSNKNKFSASVVLPPSTKSFYLFQMHAQGPDILVIHFLLLLSFQGPSPR